MPRAHRGRRRPIAAAATHALAVSAVVLGLMWYWFAVADRYAVFLYGHIDHPVTRIPAQAFDPITSSRYWMTGLVAGGAVMVLYGAAVALAGWWRRRTGRTYTPPAWWRVWLCAAPLLVVGIPVITSTQNVPTLPPALAAAVTVTALLGVALALSPADWLARQPVEVMWLGLDAPGLMMPLLLTRAVELPARGIMETRLAWLVAVAGVVGGTLWLVGTTLARRRRRRSMPGTVPLLVAGTCGALLVAPLVHHLLFTPPGFRYITCSTNVFGFDPRVWWLAAGITVLMAVVVTHWRRAITPLRSPVSSPSPAPPRP